MFGFDALPVRRPAQDLRGRHPFAGITDLTCLGHHGFGASSDAAGLGVLSLGNNPGPTLDALQCTQGSYQKVSPFGTLETLVARSDLRKPEKTESVLYRNSVTPTRTARTDLPPVLLETMALRQKRGRRIGNGQVRPVWYQMLWACLVVEAVIHLLSQGMRIRSS